MKNERQWRDDVLRRLERLADQKANDAVKLAFLTEERVEEIDGMDLRALNGAVEIKLVDKVQALEKLCEIAHKGGDGAEHFFRALESSARDGRPDEEREEVG